MDMRRWGMRSVLALLTRNKSDRGDGLSARAEVVERDLVCHL
jgi:hypothetical protein